MKNRKRSVTAIITILIPMLLFGIRILHRYDRFIDGINLSTQFTKLVGMASSDDTSDQTEEPKPTPTNKIEVLESIGYYGDPETCLMTAEQARQLADFVLMRYIIDGEEQPEFFFMLGDFAGDGIPYLHVNQHHREDIIGSAWDILDTDSDTIIALGEAPQVIFELIDEGSCELAYRHPLDTPVILSHRQTPNELDFIGKYYTFSEGDIHLAYAFERIYNPDDTMWYITENGNTIVYTSDEYHALPAEKRNDPVSSELALMNREGPSSLGGMKFTISQFAEALDLYADFVEAETVQ